MGSIFKRGKVYWILYYQNGKRYRESSGSDKKMVAQMLLKKREGEIAQGKVPGINFEKVIFDNLAELLIRDYKINNKRSLKRTEQSLIHLNEYFKGMKTLNITVSVINKYVDNRQKEGSSNGTINRELSALKRMFNIGKSQGIIENIPIIKNLKESGPRTGFFEHEDFLKIRDALPEYIQGLFTFGYRTGWRIQEILTLQWSQVDCENWIVRLSQNETKNEESRMIFLDNDLIDLFKVQLERRKVVGVITPYVFPNREGTAKIHNFRKSWNTAFRKVGLPKKIFHDLRRTAVRNMIRAGIPEIVAMKISGHKTRAVFDRYNIVNENDLKNAANKQEIYLSQKSATISATVVNFSNHKRNITP